MVLSGKRDLFVVTVAQLHCCIRLHVRLANKYVASLSSAKIVFALDLFGRSLALYIRSYIVYIVAVSVCF